MKIQRMNKNEAMNRQAGRKKGFIAEMKANWELYLLLAPAVLYILLFHYKPMGGVLMAFQDYSIKKGILGSEWVWFENFERLFNSYWFPIALKNTLTLSLLSLAIGFPVPIILALVFNEIKNARTKKFVQTVAYAPHFISVAVVCSMVTMFLDPNFGVINLMLEAVGLDSVYFLAESELFPWINEISGVWQGAGWSAIIYIAALAGVDKSLLESAQIDGANRFQRMRYINFPVLVPTIVIMFILRCGSVLSVGYEKVYLLQNNLNLTNSEILSTYIYKVGLIDSDYAYSAASGLFNSIVNGLILITVNKLAAKYTESSLW